MVNKIEKVEVSTEANKVNKSNPQDNAVLQGLNSFFEFASTDKGGQLIGMFMKKSVEKEKWRNTPKYVVGGLAVTAGCLLSFYDKFDPSIAVLLGSVVGYVLGKDSNN